MNMKIDKMVESLFYGLDEEEGTNFDEFLDEVHIFHEKTCTRKSFHKWSRLAVFIFDLNENRRKRFEIEEEALRREHEKNF